MGLETKKQTEDWIRTHWRPMMAFVYMAIVIFDFIVGPIFWSIIQLFGGSVAIQWSPLTLIAGGIFHAAMGAVLGISAFSRGKEKIEALRNEYHDEGKNRNDSLM
jgi:hypothetical protein